jgi:hypothetical protein
MMANYFQTLGYADIRADLQGYNQPELIWWMGKERDAYRPDVTCLKNDGKGTPIILEAETCESIAIDHTRQQWQLFSARAKQIGGEFHVVVPKVCTRNNQLITGAALISEVELAWNITINQKWWPKD